MNGCTFDTYFVGNSYMLTFSVDFPKNLFGILMFSFEHFDKNFGFYLDYY